MSFTQKKRTAILVGVLGAAVLLVVCGKCRCVQSQRWKAACLHNLRMIDAAMRSCALEIDANRGDTLPLAKLVPYIKGRALPKCPSGVDYVVPPVGESPTCPYHGNLLAEVGDLE